MATIIIFDLDDTLVNHRMKIPRQTYHMLNKFKKLNYKIGIITYNSMVNLVANETNLYKYTSHILYGNLDRDLLFDKMLNFLIKDYNISVIDNLYYVDDRADNLDVVVKSNTQVKTFHCVNMYKLYQFKFLIS